MSFLDLEIKDEYRSLIDDVANEFYIPLLNQAVCYKRAVGYFSSNALIEISKGICGLIQNGGYIQLVASPYLSEDDVKAINEGYAKREVIEKALLESLLPPTELVDECRLNLLANLIANNRMDIKIAFTENNKALGMYHEKMGLIYDSDGNVVAFSGSMNETNAAMVYNYETIDVFCSWKKDNDRVVAKEKAFESIWSDTEPNIQIIEFPKVKEEILKKYLRGPMDWTLNSEAYSQEADTHHKIKARNISMPPSLSLHDYQVQAIDAWKSQGFRGIFDMATGTGKTITGLSGMIRLYEHVQRKLAVVIVCPFQHLVDQWAEEIVKFNIEPIIGHSGSYQKDYKKRIKNAVIDFNLGVKPFLCLICTNATFALPEIQHHLLKLKDNVLLMVDEAHNFGAANISKTLQENYRYRLALSATLERNNDEEGTALLKNYFGNKCIEYGLQRAIAEEKLTPYYYRPIVTSLSAAELEQYTILSKEIGKCVRATKNGKAIVNEQGKRLLIKRARIVAGASEKATVLCEMMEQYKNDNHMLVYCGAARLIDCPDDDSDDIRQIDYITLKLGNELNMMVSQFTSKEDSEKRNRLIGAFEKGETMQALIAIKCLDEGVNIPAIKTAFILASTTNPKEYIQRRGRVLRLAPDKKYAMIYDFVTLPRPLDSVQSITLEEMAREKSLVRSEYRRIVEFKNLSLNPYDSDKLLDEIAEVYGLDEQEGDQTEEYVFTREVIV